VFVVLASQWDEQAAALVRDWSGARLLTPDDLSLPGWVFCSSRPQKAIIVAGGEPLPVAEISGVFTRLPQVMPHELIRIVPADRAYVAAEMHAFLLAWLTSLQCPVVNCPSPQCLAGPAWGRERWVYEAAMLDIPVVEVARASAGSPSSLMPGEVVTVVGQTILGTPNEQLRANAARLATGAKVTVLAASFQDGALLSASPWIDIADATIVEALASHFSVVENGL